MNNSQNSFQSSPHSSHNFSLSKSDCDEVKVEEIGSDVSINEIDQSEDMIINEDAHDETKMESQDQPEIQELQVQ